MATAAQVQSGAAGLYPRSGGGAFQPRSETGRMPVGTAHSRYRLRRRHPVGAAGAAWRLDGRRRSGDDEYRGRAQPRRARAASRSIIARPPPRPGRRGRALRHRAGHGSGRARRRRRSVRAPLRRDGEAGRHDGRGHAQPHHEELRARHRRRGIYPALAAARDASLGQVRDAGRTGNGDEPCGFAGRR